MKQEMYDYLKIMDESSNWWYRGRRAILDVLAKKYLPQNQKLNILDIGCGMGSEFKWLEKYGTVFGVDPSKKAVEYSKGKVQNPDLIITGELPNNINFNTRFDFITALDVIEHIQEDVSALQYINQNLLKTGGLIFVTVP